MHGCSASTAAACAHHQQGLKGQTSHACFNQRDDITKSELHPPPVFIVSQLRQILLFQKSLTGPVRPKCTGTCSDMLSVLFPAYGTSNLLAGQPNVSLC